MLLFSRHVVAYVCVSRPARVASIAESRFGLDGAEVLDNVLYHRYVGVDAAVAQLPLAVVRAQDDACALLATRRAYTHDQQMKAIAEIPGLIVDDEQPFRAVVRVVVVVVVVVLRVTMASFPSSSLLCSFHRLSIPSRLCFGAISPVVASCRNASKCLTACCPSSKSLRRDSTSWC